MSDAALSKDTPPRLAPLRDEDSAAFFDGAKRGVLMVQHCAACGMHSLIDSKLCPKCLAPLQWREASGLGQVATYSVVAQAAHPGFAADVPYAVSYVRLAEGPQIAARLVDIDLSKVHVGLRVKVKFVANPGGESTPVFTAA